MTINNQFAQLYVTGSNFLNYEIKQAYTLNLIATDSNVEMPLSVEASVDIKLLNVNEVCIYHQRHAQ